MRRGGSSGPSMKPRRNPAVASSTLVSSFHKVTGPSGEPCCFIGMMPISPSGAPNASNTEATLSVSIHAPSLTRSRRNDSRLIISASPSSTTGTPSRLNLCSVVSVSGTRLPESCRRSGSSGKMRIAFVRTLIANVRGEARRIGSAEHENKTGSRRRLQHVCSRTGLSQFSRQYKLLPKVRWPRQLLPSLQHTPPASQAASETPNNNPVSKQCL